MRIERSRAATITAGFPALTALLLLTVISCTRAPADGEVSGGGEGLSGKSVNAELLAEVMQADRRFAESVAERGVDAWVAAFADDGAMIPASGPVTTGHEAIRETMAPAFGRPDFSFVWEPRGGTVSTAGDLAYTWGDYETKSGSQFIARGRYVTVWQRRDDGVWKVVADIGNRELPESDGSS